MQGSVMLYVAQNNQIMQKLLYRPTLSPTLYICVGMYLFFQDILGSLESDGKRYFKSINKIIKRNVVSFLCKTYSDVVLKHCSCY